MARPRTKKRTQAALKDGKKPMDRGPKSMVIRIGAGEVGRQVGQLVKDMRLVMEPHTASRLQERKSNKLRDYTTMCGPLGVSHLLLFSKSSSGNINLRIAITPRGPTLHFRVENYSLCKDIVKSLRHPVTGSKKPYINPPLLVMNHFTSGVAPGSNPKSIPKHLESLITTVFQSLFPPISPQTTPLTSIHRVLLLERQLDETSSTTTSTENDSHPSYTLYLRHYHIATKITGLPKPLKRLDKVERAIAHDKTLHGRRPNLGRMEDVADYFLGDHEKGYVSASETEVETDAEVEVLAPRIKKVLSRSEREALRAKKAAAEDDKEAETRTSRREPIEKRAVKLTELGPRMKLRLTKVEEGVCTGKVLWHEFVTKTKDEERSMDEMWETRRQEKAERQRIQKENVEKKRKERKANSADNGEDGNEDDDDMEDALADADMMDWDDDEWDSDAAEDEDDGQDADDDSGAKG